MILVEVAQFVINVERTINLLIYFDIDCTVSIGLVVTLLTILEFKLLDLVRHHVHDHSKCQENYAKNDENGAG